MMDPLIFSAGAFSTVGIAALYSLKGLYARLAWKPERAAHALANGRLIVQLISNVQQHRGMSGAWLAGNGELGARLPDRQAAVATLFDQLTAGACEEGGETYPCFASADVASLRNDWTALVTGLSGHTPESSFLSHCRIVAKLLDWLGALGEARIEQPLAGSIGHEVARNFSQRLPVLAECLGQARALATAVAASGDCPPVTRVRLLFLVSRARALLTMSAEGAGADASRHADAQQAVEVFMQAICVRLLGGGQPTMNASECFDLGTSAVDSVFAWLERERMEIENELSRVSGSRRWLGMASA